MKKKRDLLVYLEDIPESAVFISHYLRTSLNRSFINPLKSRMQF